MSSPLVSVIIPVYNAMPFLRDCLDSVCSQTLEDIEIICVDDGSMDDSRETLETYASKDSRIKIVDGGGPGSNGGTSRNLGFDNASGNYAIFLDADDFFEPDMLELAYKSAIENDSDVVLFNGDKFDNQTQEKVLGYEVLRSRLVPEEKVFAPEDIFNHIFQITSPSPWAQLYKRSYLLSEDIRFQSLPNTNDIYMTFMALACARRISIVNKPLVHYRINTYSSIQDGKWCQPLCFLEAFSAIEARLIDKGLYESFKESFIESVLVHTKFNLNTQKNFEARMAIMDAIEDGRFLQFGPLSEGADALSTKAKNVQASLRAAIRQRNFFLDTQNPPMLDAFSADNAQLKPFFSLVVVDAESIDRKKAFEPLASLSETGTEIVLATSQPSKDILKVLESTSSMLLESCSVRTIGSGDTASLENAGMDAARGEYLLILEANQLNVINFESLKACMESLQKDDLHERKPDLIWIGPLPASNEEQARREPFDQMPSKMSCSGKALLKKLCFQGAYNSSPQNYIFNKNLALKHAAKFRNGTKHSEIGFTFKLMAFAENCMVSSLQANGPIEENDSLGIHSFDFNDAFGFSWAAHTCERLLEDTRASWDAQELDAALRLIRTVFDKAVATYIKMPKSERGARLALEPFEELIYRQNVIVPASKKIYEEKLEKATKRIKTLEGKARKPKEKSNSKGPAPKTPKTRDKRLSSFRKRLFK